MNWVDCGINLFSSQFERPEQVLNSAVPQVDRFVVIASDVDEAQRTASFCAVTPGCIGTAGVHPHQADEAAPHFIQELRQLAQQPGIRAIGECGLDYNRNYSAPARQRKVFAAQVALAVELQLPLYLHERDALTDQLAILNEHKGALPPLLVHCFTQGANALDAYQALDAYIGVSGWVCDERRGADLQQAVPYIHKDRLLLETDAPYLLPRSLKPRPKSRVNVPKWLPHIAETVAALRGVSVDDLAAETTANAIRLFGDWPRYEAVL
ncbi:hydrolase TatD [Aliidiomarina taiwanensis]|uniref:Hydrolase TatD n=1 Tax=Aliidiomarina taiwanensis TaxID=946228 RepID=A0A432X122_9GAMM|nr:TatD family hydrolase [Aliidiomarina taiwanensis]RUO39803.1 hydrolase TatD [Aliidiomarina taiwanensis]